MKTMFQSMSADSDQSEAFQIAGVAAGIRKEIFKCEGFKFSGHFPSHSECYGIPYNLKLLISMILYGPTPKSKENINSRACLTVSQIILFSTKKRRKELIKPRANTV